MSAARIDVKAAQLEVARLVLEAAGNIPVGDVVTLQSDSLPFTLQLYLAAQGESESHPLYGHRRRSRSEAVSTHSPCAGRQVSEATAWIKDGRTSVLALESNDIQLSNAFVISDAGAAGNQGTKQSAGYCGARRDGHHAHERMDVEGRRPLRRRCARFEWWVLLYGRTDPTLTAEVGMAGRPLGEAFLKNNGKGPVALTRLGRHCHRNSSHM